MRGLGKMEGMPSGLRFKEIIFSLQKVQKF